MTEPAVIEMPPKRIYVDAESGQNGVFGVRDSLRNVDCSKQALNIATTNLWHHAKMVSIHHGQFTCFTGKYNISVSLESNDDLSCFSSVSPVLSPHASTGDHII
jgi:hypothetical protein